ncbi:hypothetical protein [Actinomadura fibrosa]|uniref:Uncharacterized protein n=1 Tax=Actinomadura fibrosa TaxID=111802 RepID=A0ABW2XRE6_9ACTN
MNGKRLAAGAAGTALAAALGLGIASAPPAAAVPSAAPPAAGAAPAAATPAARGGRLPEWVKALLEKAGSETVVKLKKSAKLGYGPFRSTWNASVPSPLRRIVGTGPVFRAAFRFFKALH